MVHKATKKIICTEYTNGKMHDFKLFKRSRLPLKQETKALVDTGFIGIKKIHGNSELPKKKSKKNPLTKEDKLNNQKISSERVLNENVIGMIKRFKIIDSAKKRGEHHRSHRGRGTQFRKRSHS